MSDTLRAAAQAVVNEAEPDDDFDGDFVDYLVPFEAVDALRAALAAGVTLAPDADRLRAAAERVNRAVDDEGPVSGYHRATLARHRKEWPVLWAAIDRLRAALAATPEPTPAPPAGLDVERLAAAMRFGVAWVAIPHPNEWLAVARKVAAEYEADEAATTTKPQATEPPDSDQYDVVIPEPRL